MKLQTAELKSTTKELRLKDFAIESSTSAIAFVDTDEKISYLNPSSLKLLGYNSEKEVLGRDVSFFYDSKKDFNKLVGALRKAGSWAGEVVVRKKDGTLFSIYLTANVVRDDKGRPINIMGSFVDTTHQKLLQEKLIRSERLAATGQLAASIAHEINSPLQAITFLLTSLKEKYQDDKELLEDIELLRATYGSIRDTVKNLLDLNRPGKERKQPVDINSIIVNTVSLLRSYLKKNKIHLELNLSNKVPSIKASPQQLGQVLMNLIKNSVEAINSPSGSVPVSQVIVEGGQIIIRTRLRKGNVIIEVSDTGSGISKESMKNIFDPFFTKKKKMGMGVGLSICHGIIEDHNGSIDARNSPQGGAVFTIKLPISD